jgi:hypothetical protein
MPMFLINSGGCSRETGAKLVAIETFVKIRYCDYLNSCLDRKAPRGVPASLDLLAIFFSNKTIASSLQLVPHVPLTQQTQYMRQIDCYIYKALHTCGTPQIHKKSLSNLLFHILENALVLTLNGQILIFLFISYNSSWVYRQFYISLRNKCNKKSLEVVFHNGQSLISRFTTLLDAKNILCHRKQGILKVRFIWQGALIFSTNQSQKYCHQSYNIIFRFAVDSVFSVLLPKYYVLIKSN